LIARRQLSSGPIPVLLVFIGREESPAEEEEQSRLGLQGKQGRSGWQLHCFRVLNGTAQQRADTAESRRLARRITGCDEGE